MLIIHSNLPKMKNQIPFSYTSYGVFALRRLKMQISWWCFCLRVGPFDLRGEGLGGDWELKNSFMQYPEVTRKKLVIDKLYIMHRFSTQNISYLSVREKIPALTKPSKSLPPPSRNPKSQMVRPQKHKTLEYSQSLTFCNF